MELFNWEGFKNYVNTYDPKEHAANKNSTIVNDMLYGIGVYLNKPLFETKTGFDRFKNYLIRFILIKNIRFTFKNYHKQKRIWVEQQDT